MAAVVECGVFGEEATAGWGVVGVSEVGEDDCCVVFRFQGVRVVDDADAEFVGAAFESDGIHRV